MKRPHRNLLCCCATLLTFCSPLISAANGIPKAELLVKPVKGDLAAAATGIGGFGGGLGGFGGGGFGGGGVQGGGFGGNYGGGFGGGQGFGGGKKVGGGNTFGSTFGGDLKNIKGHHQSFGNAFNANVGNTGNVGFVGKAGHVNSKQGHVNKGLKKGQFGQNAAVVKGAKSGGNVFVNNDIVTKAAKGHKFGAKGAHKKGHATKGFRNTHHKDEFQKNHAFHDTNNVEDFFHKFGDEGAFKNDASGKNLFNGHHSNVFNKNHNENAGTFLNGHDDVANKGISNQFGQKAHNNFNSNFAKKGGESHANNFNKGIQHADQYGNEHGLGFGKKHGGFEGNGYQGGGGGGFGGGGNYGGGNYGGGGFGLGGGGLGFGR